MEKKDVTMFGVLKIAGAYMASIIGAGFATGQEILQFFSGYGIGGVWGTLVSTIVLALMGALFMKHGYEHQLSSPLSITQFYFSRRGAVVIEALTEIFLYCIFFIMISGSGTILSEFFGFSPWTGRIFISALIFFTAILGLRRFTDLLGILGPILIAFTLFTGIYGILKGENSLSSVPELLPSFPIVRAEGGWFVSSLLYPAFNAMTVFYFLCNAGRSASSRKEVVYGGLLGGLFLGAAILIMNLAFLANLGSVWDKEIPTITLAGMVSPWFRGLFSVLICVGIYGVSVPSLWSVTRHFGEDGTRRAKVAAFVLTLSALFMSITDFRTLVNTIYPFSGYVSLLLLGLLFWREWGRK